MNRSLPLSLLLVAACATVDDPVPATPLPANYATAGSAAEPASEPIDPDRRWWLALNDPQLEAVVEASLAQNLSIAARRAQILQAEALVDQARAGRFPQVRLNGSVGYSRSVGAFGSITSQTASASIPVSYEVDLFARYARNHQAAEREMEATVEDFRAAQIATSAQVAEAFYDAVFARARVAVLEHQVEVNDQYLELVMLRFREGLVASLDVHQQRQQTLGAKANLELAQGQVVLAEQQLAALLGMPSLDPALAPTGRTDLPELGPAPAPGVPAALLDQRPDVRAARKRIEAADRRVASAIAARLPSIRLNVTPGYTWNRNEFGSDSPIGGGGAQVSSGWTFNAGATLDMPLFDGFATRSQVDVNSAQLQVQIETLQNLVVTALIEVESSLVREKQLRRNVEILESQVEVAQETLEAARERYRSGLSDFLPVLAAIQSSQGAELAVLQAQRDLLSARIQLYRALGGTWPDDIELVPTPSEIREEEQ
ncbi:MAG: TolC family protein [Deltaproteobacteria bacterium]|nr:TolC family protein [Deltaproteobacteria bacterium]